MIEMKTTGFDELEKLLATLSSDAAASVARTAVSAGLKVLRSAGVRASKGRIKLEWGSVLIPRGNKTTGLVGLGVGGYRSNVARPHGKYLEDGTQYIAAQRFASNAMQGAMGKAGNAMARAARKRVERMTPKK